MGGQPAGAVTAGMRRMLWIAAVLVLIEGTVLLAAHDSTARYFSWTIAVPVTAAFLGASYLSAALLEAAAARQGDWERARIAVPGVLAFTTLTLIVTLVHLGKFHFAAPAPVTRIATWGWLAIYAGVPPVLAYLWWRQVQQAPATSRGGRRLPPVLRAVLGLQGMVLLLLGGALMTVPARTAGLWPWPLTALTGRAIGAWLIALGIIAGQSWYLDRREPLAIIFPATTLFAVLQLAVLAGFGNQMHGRHTQVWCYLLFLTAMLAAGIAGMVTTRRELREGSGMPPATDAPLSGRHSGFPADARNSE
jgi:hypothetical protein